MSFKSAAGVLLGAFLLFGPIATVPPAAAAPAEEHWQPWDDNGTEGWFAPEPKYDDGMTPAPWEEAFRFFRMPAGSHGWIVAKGDNLEFEDDPGRPIRFKGITTHTFCPPLEKAESYAHILRKFGFNEVRFHSLCEGLLKNEGQYTLPELDPDRMKKFDNYFAELKKAGIYVRMSGNYDYGCYWAPSTGVHDAEKMPQLNDTEYIVDEKHQELYLKSLVLFLNHVNPYTGLCYAADPAFNMYMVVNESSLFFNDPEKQPDYYRIELEEKYNAWLKEKYGSDAALREAWQVPGQESPLAAESLASGTVAPFGIWGIGGFWSGIEERYRKRGADQLRFYYKLETDWFGKVARTIRETGSRMLVQSSSWSGPGPLQELQSASAATLDFTGKHTYWLHPSGGWTLQVARFANEPVERHPADHLLLCCYQHVAGKPFNITEWNFTYPNDYTTEAAVFMAAYGALQNVSANHRFDAEAPEFLPVKEDFFDVFGSPAGLAVEPMAYFLYVRGDLRPAPVIHQEALTEAERFDPCRGRDLPREGSEPPYYIYFGAQTVPRDAMLVGGVRLSLDPAKYPAIWDEKAYNAAHDAQAGTITSVTGELVWNTRGGFIQVQTPKTRCVMGALLGKHENGPLIMDLSRAYGVAGMASLDDRALETSRSILLTLAGRDRNSGQTLEVEARGDQPMTGPRSHRMGLTGGPPVIEEPVTVDFSLKTEHNGTWTVLPVDVCGRPLVDRQRSLTAADGVLRGKICNRDDKALNYILTVK